MLIDGQWVSPTGRTKRVRSDGVSGPSLLDGGEPDQQATHLVDLPPVPSRPVSASSTISTGRVTRRELGERLFSWGTEHGYPQFHVLIPARVCTIADGEQSPIHLPPRLHIISTGVGAWRIACFQCPQPVVEAALEQMDAYKMEWPEMREEEKERRLALVECGRAREWARFTFKATTPEMRGYHFTFIVDGSEQSWMRFAFGGRYDHVCEACTLLEQKKEVVQ